MKRYIFLTLMAAVTLLAGAQRPTMSGPWHGDLRVGQATLPLVMHISEADSGPYTATLDSPTQGAKGIPATITVEADTLIDVTIPSIGARYKATYRGDAIAGTFEQSGMSLPLDLERGEPERPQTPKPPFPYQTHEVTFVNPSDSAILCGTLTLPLMYLTRKNIPTVVMVTGSGQQNRDEEVFMHKPFAVIAHHLALNGIASLRYDDRGVGSSTGAVDNATTATFVGDAEAAVDFLRSSYPRLGKIGILGHSEGGTIALIAAAEGKADFVVSIAGATISGRDIMLLQNRALMKQQYSQATTDDYIAALSRVFDYMVANPSAREWPELDQAIADLTYLNEPMIANLHQVVASNIPWLNHFLSFDPTADIARVSCPVMAVNGSLDMQVDSHTNLIALRNHLPANTLTLIKEYPALNHLMQHALTGSPAEYAVIDETISPELLADIAKWINSLPK